MIDIVQNNLMAACGPMAVQQNKPRTPVADRLIRLRKAYGYETTTALAHALGVSVQRVSNVENGKPLGRDLAFLIVKKHPEVTVDWLWNGANHGLSVRVARLLGELGGSEATKTRR